MSQTNEQKLQEILGMTSSTEEASPVQQTETLDNLDLIRNQVEVLPQATTKQQKKKSKTNFAENGTNRFLLIAGALGLGILGLYLFMQSAFNFESLPSTAEIPEPAPEETQISINQETDNDNYRAKVALDQQAAEIKAINELNNAQEIQPKIIVEKTEPEISTLSPAKPTPAPISRPAVPRIQPLNRPVVKRNPVPTEPEYDSIQDWTALANLGSYGYTSQQNNTTGNPTIKTIAPTPVKSQVPSLIASNFKNISDLKVSETKAINLFNQTPGQIQPQPIIRRNSNSQTIAIGQRIKARLTNPVQTAQGQREQITAFVELKEPVINTKGKIAIPKHSQIIYQIQVEQNGLIQAIPQTVLIGDRQLPLPKQAFSLKNNKGGVLIAKFKHVKNTSGNRDAINFSLGATQAVSDIISRPSSSSSIITNSSSSQNIEYGETNYPIAIASQGAEKILDTRSQELNQQYLSTPTLSLWEIKEGTKLTLFINSSFNLNL